MWNQHCEARLQVLLGAGVRIEEMERLAQLIIRAPPGDACVGVYLGRYVQDPTNRNYRACDCIGAIVRTVRGRRIIKTLFLGRMEQFDHRKRERLGCRSPERHFNVERVVLE